MKYELNPLYTIKQDDQEQYLLQNKLTKSILIKWSMNNKKLFEMNSEYGISFLNNVEILLHTKLLVTNTEEKKFIQDILDEINLLDKVAIEDTNINYLFGEWLNSNIVNSVFFEGEFKTVNLLRPFESEEEATLNLAIAHIQLPNPDIDLIYDKLKIYENVIFVLKNEINNHIIVGPFLNKLHLKKENISTTLTNEIWNHKFKSDQLEISNVSLYENNIIRNIILEIISNYTLGIAPLHNRQVYISYDHFVKVSPTMPII